MYIYIINKGVRGRGSFRKKRLPIVCFVPKRPWNVTQLTTLNWRPGIIDFPAIKQILRLQI